MPAGHQKTVTEVTGSLPASGGSAPSWTGQRTDVRFFTADSGSPLGPAGWLARALTISAQPAQACSVLVEGGFISGDIGPPGYIANVTPAAFVNGLPPYDPMVWTSIATVSFSAGQLKSQTIIIEPYRFVRVRLANGSVSQGPVTISEQFGEE